MAKTSLMPITVRLSCRFMLVGFIGTLVIYVLFRNYFSTTVIDVPALVPVPVNTDYRRRPECTCSRPDLPPFNSNLASNQIQSQSLLCSHYASQRGLQQRIISISLFGPKENKMFQFNKSRIFLNELINDLNIIYADGFVLRVHHDETINLSDVVCPIECQNPNVDFCSMNSKLYIPPKIWRFIPAGDPLVDISKFINAYRVEPDKEQKKRIK